MDIKDWNIEELTGYKPLTSIYQNLSIADKLGINEIKKIYNIAFKNWKTNYKLLTELVIALNWKLWEHYENNNQTLSILYDELWQKTDNYALNNLKNDELNYFIRTTD